VLLWQLKVNNKKHVWENRKKQQESWKSKVQHDIHQRVFCGIYSAVTLFCNGLVWAMGTGVMASSVSISCSLEGSWLANVMVDLYVGNYRRNRNTYWLLLRNNMGYHCFACSFHSLECSLWFLLCVLFYTCVSLLDQKLQSKEILCVQVESSICAAIWSWTLPLNIYFLFTQLLRVLSPQRFCLCMCLTLVFLLFVLLSSLLFGFTLLSIWISSLQHVILAGKYQLVSIL
jgi:hypothetical protein